MALKVFSSPAPVPADPDTYFALKQEGSDVVVYAVDRAGKPVVAGNLLDITPQGIRRRYSYQGSGVPVDGSGRVKTLD